MRHFLLAVNLADLVQRADGRAQPAVDCEHARVDQGNHYLYANPAREKILGIPNHAIIGRTPLELGTPVELATLWTNTTGEVFRTGEIREMEYEVQTPAGMRACQARVAPEFGPDGTVANVVIFSRDITRRKRAEEALQASDQAYRALADNAPDMIVRVDRDIRYVYANPAREKILGTPSSAIIGKTPMELGMPTELATLLVNTGQEVFRTGEVREVEYEIPTKAGVRVFQSRVAAEFGPDATVEHVVVFSRDITRHKRVEEALIKAGAELEQRVQERTAELAEVVGKLEKEVRTRVATEQTLRESEDKYRALVEKTSDIMYATNTEGQITYISPQVARLGLTPEQVIGHSFLEFISPLDRDEAERDFRTTFETGQEIPTTFRFMNGQGKEIWLEDQGKIRRDADGKILGLIGMVRDVTDRKRAEIALRTSEEQNRALLNAIPDLMFLLDHDGRFLSFHSVVIAKLYVAPDQFLGKRVTEVLPPAVAALIMAKIGELRVAGTVTTFEYELLLGPEPCWYEANATRCGSDNILVIARDVTQRRQVELRLREANAALEQRGAQLRALASELTLAEQRERRRLAELLHDHLQQLLVGATLRLPFLERSTDPAVQQVAGEIDSLLAQALECSRSLTGELCPPILHEGGLVPALKWLAGWMQEKHRLTVVLRADADATPTTEDLTVLLFQSVRELLFNAAKYAKVQTVTVEVHRRNDEVETVVTDEGSGFDPAELRAAGGSASGFGLLGIRERLDFLGGRMEIASTPGRGSRFTLWVPVRGTLPGKATTETAVVATGDTAAAAGTTGPPENGERKIRVLLVDDHSVVRQALAHLLGNSPDIEVVGEAADGRAASELVRKLRPDVVTMDISMPGMNGIEATRIIHAEFPTVRIIGLSLFTDAERAEEMRRAGAAEYLTKSGPAAALLAAIRGTSNKTPSGFPD